MEKTDKKEIPGVTAMGATPAPAPMVSQPALRLSVMRSLPVGTPWETSGYLAMCGNMWTDVTSAPAGRGWRLAQSSSVGRANWWKMAVVLITRGTGEKTEPDGLMKMDATTAGA